MKRSNIFYFYTIFAMNVYFKFVGLDILKDNDEKAQELIKNLQVFEIVCSKIHKCFIPKVIFKMLILIF